MAQTHANLFQIFPCALFQLDKETTAHILRMGNYWINVSGQTQPPFTPTLSTLTCARLKISTTAINGFQYSGKSDDVLTDIAIDHDQRMNRFVMMAM